jgi:hypothetical protein
MSASIMNAILSEYGNEHIKRKKLPGVINPGNIKITYHTHTRNQNPA